MPTLKHIGDEVLQEIGCPVTTTPPLSVLSPAAEQHCDTMKTTIELTQDTMTELERLHKNFCELYFNAIKELRRFCEDKKGNLLDIATYATLLTSADVKLTDSTDINDLFGKLHPNYDFIDCDIIKDIVTKFLPESTIIDDIVKHVEDTEKFIDSQPISTLIDDLEKVMIHTQVHVDSDTHMAPITIKISRKWREKHIKNLRTLIDYLMPQPYPKISLFKYITIKRSSIYIQYLVLQSYVEATISHAKQHLRFMNYIGIYNLVIDGTIVVQSDEDLDFSFDQSLIEAISEDNVETVQFLLSIGANINYQNTKPLIHGQCHVAKIADTPLMIACRNGYCRIVELLLHNSVDPSIQKHDGFTALLLACQNGHYQVAELLLNNNVDPNIQKKDGCTALMLACQNGHYQVAELLLNNNIDPNFQMKDGWTALMSACQNGHYQVAELLLNNNVDPNTQKKDGCTALMLACQNGHYQVAELLLNNNIDPNFQMKDGWTALMSACQNGHYQVAELLLNNNADPNIQEQTGRTALMVACENEHYQVAELLLNNNADPNIQEQTGRTALMSACENGHYQVAELLLNNNVDPNFQMKDGWTALMLACQNGHYQVAELLLVAKANPNITNNNGWTPLLFAIRKHYANIVQIILDHGAHIDYRSTVTGETALILAGKLGYVEIVRKLLEKGADTSIKTFNGDTAFTVAANTDIVELLTSYAHRYKLVRSVSQYKLSESDSQLSMSSLAESLTDGVSLLSKATLSSDSIPSDNNSYKVIQLKVIKHH